MPQSFYIIKLFFSIRFQVVNLLYKNEKTYFISLLNELNNLKKKKKLI